MKKIAIHYLHALLFFVTLLPQLAQASDYTNSIGMQFKIIPAGSFIMGSCHNKSGNCPVGAMDPDANSDETPQHRVRITKAFQLGMYEVTIRQFKEFITFAGREDLLTKEFNEANRNGEDAAVSWVSWNDVQAFIIWLNQKEGGNRYRLPTEAEWEYAARAGTTTRYSWSNSPAQANRYAWYNKAGVTGAKKVGGKQANSWGLYDMHGNVYEWVQDWYEENYYRNSPKDDPKGPSSGWGHVFRGGGWRNCERGLRSAFRFNGSSDDRDNFIGFRLVRQP